MKKSSKILALILSVVCSFTTLLSVSACSGTPNANVVTLSDNQALITNPNMGWNFTYYANTIYDFNNTLIEGDYLDDFPCDIVFFRIGWNWIEPQDNVYNWDFIDNVAKEWISRGKRIALCFVVTFIGDQSTPLWVKELGAQGQDYFWRPTIDSYDNEGNPIYVGDPASGKEPLIDENNGERKLHVSYVQDGRIVNVSNMHFTGVPLDAQEYARNVGIRQDADYNNGQEVAVGDYENYRGTWVPEYDDEIFLAKWDEFMAACAAHYESDEFNTKYDNDPDLDIDFLEVGSFGDWGEAHSSYTKLNTFTTATIKKHIDIYVKNFKKIQLMFNDSIPTNRDEMVDYALERGIGCSDHTVQVPDGTPGSEGYAANLDVLTQFYKDQPVLLENHNGTQIMQTYYNGVVNAHATWARINCNPNTCAFSEWTDKITLRLGYRLAFTEVAFDDIKAGGNVRIQFKMKNNGSAYCFDGGNPTFYIIDSLGRVKCFDISEFNVNQMKPAKNLSKAEEYVGTAELKVPEKMLAGDYYVVVSVSNGVDAKGNPIDTYKLPLNHQDGERLRYRIAKFTVEE